MFAFASLVDSRAGRCYLAAEADCLAVVRTTKYFRCYLYRRRISVWMDVATAHVYRVLAMPREVTWCFQGRKASSSTDADVYSCKV